MWRGYSTAGFTVTSWRPGCTAATRTLGREAGGGRNIVFISYLPPVAAGHDECRCDLPGLKPSAATVHCQPPHSFTHRCSPRETKKIIITIVSHSGSSAVATSALPPNRDSVARAVALQAEECGKRLYLLPLPPPPRHVPGRSQCAPLLQYSVSRRSSAARSQEVGDAQA